MPATAVACPDCHRAFKALPRHRGRTLRCKVCGGSIPVPVDLPSIETLDLEADAPTAATGSVYLIAAVRAERPADAEGERIRDALIEREPERIRYRFEYATVQVETVRYGTVADAVARIERFESEETLVGGVKATYRWISLRPDGSPRPSEEVARILLCEAEDGAVGKTERDAVYQRFLDFGEHSIAVSPAGIAIAGRVEAAQVEVYLYYVAQIAAAVTRYAENEALLDNVMVDIRARSDDFDIERLQQINIATSKAMLDISDELLDIPARESFILRTLLEVANVDVYEQRIARMLGIIQHHVTHRHALIAKRNSERIEFVLFVIAFLGGVTGLAGLVDVVLDHTASLALAAGAGLAAITGTLACSLSFHRRRAGETLQEAMVDSSAG